MSIRSFTAVTSNTNPNFYSNPNSNLTSSPTPFDYHPHSSFNSSYSNHSSSIGSAGFNTINNNMSLGNPVGSIGVNGGSDETPWDSLRKQARLLENEIDIKLVAFSKLASGTNGGNLNGSSQQQHLQHQQNLSDATSLELEELLKKLSQIIEALNNYLKDLGPKANPSMLHALQRHRDILYDYNKEYKKTKSNINMAKEHSELLSGPRGDSSSKLSQRSEFLLSERNLIDRAGSNADQILQSAFETKDIINKQKATYTGTSSRLAGIAGKTPFLNNVINKIQMRKRRDNLIIGGVISVCLILILMYILV
jgi:Golgi SNAP receptor complex protein 1